MNRYQDATSTHAMANCMIHTEMEQERPLGRMNVLHCNVNCLFGECTPASLAR
jgi:hypothetical protein